VAKSRARPHAESRWSTSRHASHHSLLRQDEGVAFVANGGRAHRWKFLRQWSPTLRRTLSRHLDTPSPPSSAQTGRGFFLTHFGYSDNPSEHILLSANATKIAGPPHRRTLRRAASDSAAMDSFHSAHTCRRSLRRSRPPVKRKSLTPSAPA